MYIIRELLDPWSNNGKLHSISAKVTHLKIGCWLEWVTGRDHIFFYHYSKIINPERSVFG